MKKILLLLSASLILLLAGCVTGRRELTVDIPVASTPAPASQGKVYIAAITDNREFQNKPSDPSTPSIDGDVTAISPAQKDRMIGRQRNGFGHAMGDIELAANETVTHRVRQLVTEGFKRSGYEVVSDPADATAATVSVEKFWAWSTPGAFVVTFEVKIFARITLKTATSTRTLIVFGYGMNHGQVAKDGNWREAFDPAFQDFLANFKREIEKTDSH